MADSTRPLLSDSNSSESKLPPPRSLDETIEQCIGDFGWSQFLQVTLVSFAWAFDAQQTFITVFTDSQPTHVALPRLGPMQLVLQLLHLTAPNLVLGLQPTRVNHIRVGPTVRRLAGQGSARKLLLPRLSVRWPSSVHPRSDSSLGRKNMLFLSCLIMSLSSMLTAFSTGIWVYAFLRFLNGVGRATVGTCALVLSTELVGKKWRGQVGAMGFLCFTLGFLSLPLLGYINNGNSWRYLYVWTSIPTLMYCVLVRFFVWESPRWLIVKGRKEEAVSILRSIGSNPITMSFSNLCLDVQESSNPDVYDALRILVKKPWSFTTRREALIGFTALSGISSVLIASLGQRLGSLQIVFELVSFFSACTAFNMALIYTIELFPTCVRNSALAMVRQALVFGGVFSPVMVAAGRDNQFWWYGMFGLVIGLFGLFVIGLPETRGSVLCDTMDEEEFKNLSKEHIIG